MRIFRTVAFFVLLVVPMPLFAQQNGSSSTASSIGTGFGDSSGVQNASQAAVGTFVGGGSTTLGFIGTTDIYSSSSNSSRTSSAARRTTTRTTTARSVTTTAARRATTTAGRTTQAGSSNNQTIRSVTSIDFDFAMPSQRVQSATIETQLNRVQGIQDSQVTFKSSPSGTTAVLTGTVASERQRKVAQQFLLLEPGINRVDNLLDIR